MPTKVKTYPRLAKLIARTMYNPVSKVSPEAKVQTMMLRLSVYSKRDRNAIDWEGQHAFFGRVILSAFNMRHHCKVT